MKYDPVPVRFDPGMSATELAELGVENIAYIRPIKSADVMRRFPMISGLEAGINLWALFSANGDPLALADDPAGLLSNAHDLDLQPVSLH